MRHSAQDREYAVQAITRRAMLEERIKRKQKQMAVLQGEARQALEDSLAADQAALAEATLTFEEAKASMCQEEERRRWKLQEELRLIARWRSSQYQPFPSGSSQWSPGQAFALAVLLVAMATMVSMLLLSR